MLGLQTEETINDIAYFPQTGQCHHSTHQLNNGNFNTRHSSFSPILSSLIQPLFHPWDMFHWCELSTSTLSKYSLALLSIFASCSTTWIITTELIILTQCQNSWCSYNNCKVETCFFLHPQRWHPIVSTLLPKSIIVDHTVDWTSHFVAQYGSDTEAISESSISLPTRDGHIGHILNLCMKYFNIKILQESWTESRENCVN